MERCWARQDASLVHLVHVSNSRQSSRTVAGETLTTCLLAYRCDDVWYLVLLCSCVVAAV
eukprot:jgi/Botrbrau1/14263/Bobra.113_2s0009.1